MGPGGALLTVPRHERKAAQKYRSHRRSQAPTTIGQRRKLRALWPTFGLEQDFARRWNFPEIFGYPRLDEKSSMALPAVTLDIGFGCGDSLLGMASARPDDCFVGIEVHRPGVALALARLEAEGLSNVKIVRGDALIVLMDHIDDRSLHRCCIFFPDPFPSTSERRLVRPLLLNLLSKKLRIGGTIHVATDDDQYAEHVLAIFNAFHAMPRVMKAGVAIGSGADSGSEPESIELGLDDVALGQVSVHKGISVDNPEVRWDGGEENQRPAWRPLTKYEEKAREAGRIVRDFSYQLKNT